MKVVPPTNLRKIARFIMIIGCLTTSGSAWGQALPTANEAESEWRYSITPYAYVPFSIEGTSVVAGTGIDLDLGFSDAVDLLDFAASGRFEAWKGDWGVIADLYYLDLGLGGGGEVNPPGPGGGTVDVDVDITQKWASLMVSHRFAYGTYGDRNRRFAWDGAIGVRWNSIKQEVDASVDIGGPPGMETTLGGTKTWWEPAVMLRADYEVADRWTVGGRVELGGFGVNDNNLQYTVLFGADWQGWESTSLRFGYVFYGMDYQGELSDGDFEYDIDQHGPFFSLTYRF